MAATEPKRYGRLDHFLNLDLFYSFTRSIGVVMPFSLLNFCLIAIAKLSLLLCLGEPYSTPWKRGISRLCSPHHVFSVALVMQEALEPLMRNDILTTDGPTWSRSRSLIEPIVAKAHSPSYTASFYAHVQHLIDHVPRDGSTVDLQPLFCSFVS